MTPYISTAANMLLIPLDYWKTAASSGKLLIKSLDCATTIHQFAVRYIPHSHAVSCFGCIGGWAKPTVVMFKAYTDGIEPLKDLWLNGKKNFQERNLLALAAKVALVAGLWLALPVYLGSIGAISLGSLTTNIGLTSSFLLIDAIRFTLLNLGTDYKLYEEISSKKIAKKAAVLETAKRTHEIWKERVASGDQTNYDGVTARQSEKIAAFDLQKAQYDSTCAKLGMADNSTKIALYATTLFSAYVSPINAFSTVMALNLFNKGVGCSKDYLDAKKRDLLKEMAAWQKDNHLTDAHMKLAKVA